MTVRDMYNFAVIEDYPSLIYLIEWLVHEKKALTMEHDARNVEHLMNHPTKNIWIEANVFIKKRKEQRNGISHGHG